MINKVIIKNKISSFKKSINVSGDKSLSIRWVLFASLANGTSQAKNLLLSEDVMAAINGIKKLGIKTSLNKKTCKIYGKGIDGYQYQKKIILNAKNSGTFGRLIIGLLVNASRPIKIIGDSSLSKRDFKRITDPLKKFGTKFKLNKSKNLPLTIYGTKYLKPIKYFETRGSAQCKSAVIFAGFRAKGTTYIKAKKSRNHTELLCKYLNLPIQVKKTKNYDLIKINNVRKINTINYTIPSDISSAAFFIVLTALSENSKLIIKNVNVNPSRVGIITILKRMNIKIEFKNTKIYKGEKVADIFVESAKNIKAINCPTNLNSGAIDEFLVIFLIAAKAKGISYFSDLSELNQKESPRLKLGSKILRLMGVQNIVTKNSIKIFGNPNLNINKKIVIKNFLKDHRIFMTCVIAALAFGGQWNIHDKDSIKTSFPDFLKIIKNLQK